MICFIQHRLTYRMILYKNLSEPSNAIETMRGPVLPCFANHSPRLKR